MAPRYFSLTKFGPVILGKHIKRVHEFANKWVKNFQHTSSLGLFSQSHTNSFPLYSNKLGCFAKTSIPTRSLLSSFVKGPGLIRCTDIVYFGVSPNLWPMRWAYSCYLPIASDKRLPTCLSQVQMSSMVGRHRHTLSNWGVHTPSGKVLTGRLCQRSLVKTQVQVWEQTAGLLVWPSSCVEGKPNKGFVISTASPNCVKAPLAHAAVSSRRQKWNVNL